MRLSIFALTMLVALSPVAAPVANERQTRAKQPAAPSSETRPDRKTEREVLKMEGQLKEAIARCDATLLEQLLADYYADSFKGSTKAVGKKGTIARCKNGATRYYAIDEGRKVSVRVDLVVVEGIAQRPREIDSAEAEGEVFVQRFWTKKDGRWRLVSQTVGPAERESEN